MPELSDEERSEANQEYLAMRQEEWQEALDTIFEWTGYFNHVENAIRVLYKRCPASADLRQLVINLSELRSQVESVDYAATQVANGNIQERRPRTWAEAHGQ